MPYNFSISSNEKVAKIKSESGAEFLTYPPSPVKRQSAETHCLQGEHIFQFAVNAEEFQL